MKKKSKLSTAPKVKLEGMSGDVSLSDFKGQNVVLYFYPKDNTPGCTREACDFSANISKFKKLDTVVIGVSPDSIDSHKKFRDKFKLSFDLLADPDKKVAKAFGAFGEKSLYGRKFMGIIRSTFLIDKKGNIARSWEKVKVDGHCDAVLEAIKELK